MKQKLHLFSLLLLAVAFLMPTKLMAQVTQGYYTYTLSGTEATVTKCTQTSGAVVIPETIVHGGKTYNVTAIKFNSTLFLFAPTSITGKSIKSITGGMSMTNTGGGGNINMFIREYCSSVNFPKLKVLKNCAFGRITSASVSFPELETIEGVSDFLCDETLTSVSLPKLKKLYASRFLNHVPNLTSLSLPELQVIGTADYAFQVITNLPALTSLSLPKLTAIEAKVDGVICDLPALTSLTLPELTEVKGRSVFGQLPVLTSLGLPKLKTIEGDFNFNQLSALPALNLPELVTLGGYNTLNNTPSLHTLYVPKVQTVEGTWMLRTSGLSLLNLPSDCKINSVGMMSWPDASVSSITVAGITKIDDANFFGAHGMTTLKHISFPDVVEFKGSVGMNCSAMESFSAPKLKKLNNSKMFTMGSCPNLTTVDIHSLEEVVSSQLFNDSPVTSLTLRGDLKADPASTMTLSAYPTVVFVTAQSAVNDIPASFFAGVKGGRFIAPKGKAGMYATKWNLNTAKTMVYSPVEINKSTASTLYASGSITKADASFTYGGTTYKNQYDMSHAMTAAECLDAFVLSVNDYGFTPTLATQTVQNGTDALAGFSFYYASAYADTPTRKLGDLTLTALPTTAVSTLQGFNATATSLNQGIGRDLGGFLFKGNNASVTEVYLPYTPTATTVTTNYLKAGEGNRVQTRQNNSHEFYWHPGDASFTMGFYESYNVLIPEYRSYLSIAKTLTSNAKRFNLIFEDGQTTGISTVNMSADDNSATLSDVWYTLQGTRLPVKPTAAGIYINGGRKVVIK